MSRIGKLSIPVPSGANVAINGQRVEVKGPKGQMDFVVADQIVASMEDGALTVTPRADIMERAEEAMKAQQARGRKMTLAQALPVDARTQWGTVRARLNNMMVGVTQGFTKTLELVGVGYRAQMQGTDVKLSLGFSHEVVYKAPAGITLASSKPTEIVVSGADKQAVGQVAAEIREFRPPEPYKGKGIRYAGEQVRRKEGKKK